MGVLVLVGVALTAAALARQLVAVRAGARLAAERAARANEARFRSLVENASDIILVVAEDAQIRFHTPSAERFFRRESHEIDETSLLDVVHPEDREVASALLAEAIARPRTTPVAEWRVSGGGGEWQFVEARVISVFGDFYLAGAVLILRSIYERKVFEGWLAYQAFHDFFTNFANRVLFMERLEHALRRSTAGRAGHRGLHRPQRLQERQRQPRPCGGRPALSICRSACSAACELAILRLDSAGTSLRS
jgi:PAS domain S-box-containing protein